MCNSYVVNMYDKEANAFFLFLCQKINNDIFLKIEEFFSRIFNLVFYHFFGDNKSFNKSGPVMLKNGIKCARKKLFWHFWHNKKLFWHFWPQKNYFLAFKKKLKNNYFGKNQEPLSRPLVIINALCTVLVSQKNAMFYGSSVPM